MAHVGPFTPFRSRDFALFFSAGGLSNAGTTMQAITIPFVVYELTGSRAWLGMAALLGQLPSIIANIVSGSLADRFQVKQLLLVNQAVQMTFAFAFWAMWVTGHHNLTMLLVLVVLNGVVQGMIFPIWQSFVASLVPREHLTAAIRLNSLQFSLARVLGPLAAGLTLDTWGPGVSFAANGLSYVLVLSALLVMHPRQAPRATGGSAWSQIRDGFQYTSRHVSLILACLTTGMIALCGWSLMALAPAVAKEHFATTASKTGIVNAAAGMGAVTAVLILAVHGHRFRRSRATMVALSMWIVGITTVGLAPGLSLGLVGFFVMGLGHTTAVTNLQPAIQMQVDDRYRGRVLALYMQGVVVGPSLGALAFSWISGYTGLQFMILLIAGLLASYFAVVMVTVGGFGSLDADHPVPRRRYRAAEEARLAAAGPGPEPVVPHR